MQRSKLLWQAPPIRAIVEAVLIVGGILSLSLLIAQQPALMFLAAIGLCMIGALIAALRARLPQMPWSQAVIYDGSLALLLMLILGFVLLGVSLLFPPSLEVEVWQIRYLLVIAAGLSAANFFVLRLGLRLWRLWQMTRQKRLLWSMVHAQWLTVLTLLLILLGVQAIRFFLSGPPVEILGRETTFVWISSALFILMGSTILAIPLLAVVMGLAVLMSYLTVRPITRRIETLVKAVSDFRQGDYQTQLIIEGQDEIAQLSGDFKAMAAELGQTLTDLQSERNTVAGLLQTRRQLIADVSHELRAPVATMRSYLESILAHWNDTPLPNLRHDLETIQGETTRLQALIDDLFTLSRLEVDQLTLRCELLDIKPLIQRIVDTVAPLAWQSSRVRVVADLPSHLPPARVDSGRLEQIMRNLIHNGVRHTPPGGIVAISAQAQLKQVWIEVHDTGEGIPPETLPHIWQRFYRSVDKDNLDKGTGLGLALVKELTEAMGGSVAVESAVGQGSHFTVCLPSE